MTDVPTVSVIVPLRDEPAAIGEALAGWWRGSTDSELLVADGAGCPATEVLQKAGARVVEAIGTRGERLARAAQEARGDVFFFLHGDCRPPDRALDLALHALESGAAAGAFSLAFQGARADRTLRFIAESANFRSRWLGLPFGDQGLFCRREAYAAAGGFRDLPICDDLDIVRRLKRVGRFVVLPEPMLASPRAYLERGPLSQTLRVWRVLAGYGLGVDPVRLARWYRGS